MEAWMIWIRYSGLITAILVSIVSSVWSYKDEGEALMYYIH